MQPREEYVFYCEQCKHKVLHNITSVGNLVSIHCENGHFTTYAIADLVLCYTTHCEDEAS